MRNFGIRRPSPALVVSTVALVAALGGTSYAAFSIPKNSVGTKQLKKGAVTTKKLANGAVSTGKLSSSAFINNAGHANSATTAANATNATNAGNANTVGGVPASSFEPASKIMTAVVTNSGTPTVVRGTPGVTAALDGPGYVAVTFPVDVSNCTWIATQGHSGGNASVGDQFATVRGDGSADDVGVVTWTVGGAQINEDFHLAVIC